MTLALYIGTAAEITARLSGAPASTNTTVSVVNSLLSLNFTSVTGFSVGQKVTIHQQKRKIDTIVGSTVTFTRPFDEIPVVGDRVVLYNADYSTFRAKIDGQFEPLSFVSDLHTGGQSGDDFGRELTIVDFTGEMAAPIAGNRVAVFESVTLEVLFAGPIKRFVRYSLGKNRAGRHIYRYVIQAAGYQAEADSLSLAEEPVFDVNAGVFLKMLMEKYTILQEGEIDVTNSPTFDVIRLAGTNRFSGVGQLITSLSPEFEFFIKNEMTYGAVYFRRAASSYVSFALNKTLIEAVGPDKCPISYDMDKTYNDVRFPFYRLQRREPDFFIQDTTGDDAFLKTSVTLNGQPAQVQQSVLFSDDFSDGSLLEGFTEDDLTNPAPPTGFIGSDGFLLEGSLNNVVGLHLYPLGATPVTLGDIGRATDPIVHEPFTGSERQRILAREVVVNTLGDAYLLGIMDQSTKQTLTSGGSSTTVINVQDSTIFMVGDRISVGGNKAYVQSVAGLAVTLVSALGGAPASGVTVSVHRLAKSRIKLGLSLKAAGDIKILKDSVESNPSTGAKTFTAGPTTYSFRLWMQCFETKIASGISAGQFTVADASNFATGDVVEIFVTGSREEPVQRVISKAGSVLSFAPLDLLPKVGYRVRTLPKIQIQVKGGTYGDIIGRDWTLLHQETNTYQTQANVLPDHRGVLLVMHGGLVGTITAGIMHDPPGITANIGTRFLFIGAQETDSAEPDIDCLIRNVGNHYQLDFFPDTKYLWASGTRLELRYDEKWLYEINDIDLPSMEEIAEFRGQTVPANYTEDEIKRLGGRTLDSVELLDSPISFAEAISTTKNILDAVKTLATTVNIDTDTYKHPIVTAGSFIASEITGIPDLRIEQVRLTEVAGARRADGKALFDMTILAGTVDRLQDILQTRKIKSNARLVIDEGIRDTVSRVKKYAFSEISLLDEDYALYTVGTQTNKWRTTAGGWTLWKNLILAP